MTYIDVKETGSSYDLIITGHSGYRDRGHDIVCAAISTLALTLDNYLGQGGVLRSGECMLSVDRSDRDGILLLTVIMESFERIAEQYPKFARFTFEGDINGYYGDNIAGCNLPC